MLDLGEKDPLVSFPYEFTPLFWNAPYCNPSVPLSLHPLHTCATKSSQGEICLVAQDTVDFVGKGSDKVGDDVVIKGGVINVYGDHVDLIGAKSICIRLAWDSDDSSPPLSVLPLWTLHYSCNKRGWDWHVSAG